MAKFENLKSNEIGLIIYCTSWEGKNITMRNIRKKIKHGYATFSKEPSKELLDAVNKMAELAYNMELDMLSNIKQPLPSPTFCRDCGTDPCQRLGISYAEDDDE